MDAQVTRASKRYGIAIAVATLAILLLADVTLAHHGYAVVFDPAKRITLNGTLTRIDWRNPHIEFSLAVEGDRGQVEGWAIEAGPPGFFRSRNVGRADFGKGIGQPVVVEALPARDGSRLAALSKMTFSDGTFVTSSPGA
jgi:hypothetical protein